MGFDVAQESDSLLAADRHACIFGGQVVLHCEPSRGAVTLLPNRRDSPMNAASYEFHLNMLPGSQTP